MTDRKQDIVGPVLDRVAAALWDVDRSRTGLFTHPFAELYGFRKDELRESARAALMAMRDCPLPVRRLTTFEFAELEWAKLIDAILEERCSVP